jgi:hypothetical protein
VLRRLTLASGAAAALWGFLIIRAGDGQVEILGLKLSSRHPFLLFWGGVAMLALHAYLWHPAIGRRVSVLATPSRRQALVAVAIVAILAGAASARWGSTIAGGADSYGYVSQAGLWRQGSLLIRGDIIRQSPWPLAIETWAPLGYRPAHGRVDAIAPLYPPGLPIVMALFQLVLGYCGAFLVVPLSAAATVALTFALGLRVLNRPAPALWAALLVAASPVFLFQAMNPMTDVPVTAAWTLALVLLAAEWTLAAGMAMAIALAIRPNLILLAAAAFAWTALCDWRSFKNSGRVSARTLRLGIGVAPAVIGIAWFNAYLYGSPLISGYGSLESLYSASHVSKNVSQFLTWLLETQTPIVLASAVFFVAPRWFVDAIRIPLPRVLFGGVMLGVALSYLFYIPFDGWTYLRFLLPMWPVLMLSTAFSLDAASRRWPTAASRVLVLACVALATWRGIGIAEARGSFDVWRGERKYVDVGRYLADRTDSRAVILSFQHSGSIRLYTDRLTLRWDQLDVAWLDRAVEHLISIGRHPYIVVDGDEAPLFRRLFGNLNRLGALDWTPMAVLPRPHVEIYDAGDRSARETDVITESDRTSGGWCEQPQRWPTPLRME